MLVRPARGADIRMIYSPPTRWPGQREPNRQVVFFAIGFETTTPPTALVIRQAAQNWAHQFFGAVLPCAHPPAITAILESPRGASWARCRWMVSSARPTSAP